MSVKLERDLRIYMSYLDTVLPTVAADQLVAPVVALSPAPASPQPSPRPGWLTATAATVAVVLLVGSLIVISSGSTNDPAPVATSPPIENDPAPVATSPPIENDPTEAQSVFGGLGAQVMNSVTVGGPGLVAVGSDSPPVVSLDDTLGSAAVWTSVDGFTWSRVPHDEAVFGTGGALMLDVTVGGPGLVAVGSEGRFNRESDAVVWTSVDGLIWSRVPHDEAVFGGGWINSVTAGGPGLVAVGSVNSANEPDGDALGDAAVWTSVDGITWSRVPHDEAVFGGADTQWMDEVIVGGPGLVAVGSDGRGYWDNNAGLVAAVWTSVDGITWSRVPHDDAVFGRLPELGGFSRDGMISVTAGGPGLVAVGTGVDPPVWTSVDGITWSRVTDDNLSGIGVMTGVTAGGPGLVAVGFRDMWTSVDGITWSRVPNDLEGDHGKWSVITAGTGLVAVGAVDASLAGNSDAAVWTSVDGITWSRVSHDEATAGAG